MLGFISEGKATKVVCLHIDGAFCSLLYSVVYTDKMV